MFEKWFLKNPPDEKELLKQHIDSALKDLNCARQNFDMVAGDRNVELAIFELNAAERRYQNLINRARELKKATQEDAEYAG